MGKQIWTFTLADVNKYPRIKTLHPKANLMNMEGEKFTDKEHARRVYKNKSNYKNRVNKPIIRFNIVK